MKKIYLKPVTTAYRVASCNILSGSDDIYDGGEGTPGIDAQSKRRRHSDEWTEWDDMEELDEFE